MKLRNVLVSILSLVLVAVIAVSGTVAYLQDDDSDVNVMTLGNVKIEQHEYQRAEGVAYDAGEMGAGNGVKEGALVPFVQGQGLYPAVPSDATAYTAEQDVNNLFFWGDYVYSGTAGNGLWNDSKLSNVMDKMVFVENTGKSDAYFRTLIAFECPVGMEYSQGSDREFMMNTNIGANYEWESPGYIVIDGTRYYVMVATYQNALKPGNQSHPSLLQVVMTHNATNEHMELLGDTYEILVLSQAVQTAGFADAQTALDTAFGKPSEKAAEWFGGLVIPVYGEDADAVDYVVDNGGKLFVENDITTDQITIDKDTAVEIDLQENTLGGTIENNGELNVYDGALEATYIQNTGTANFTDVEIDAGSTEHYALITKNDGAVTVYKDVDVTTYGGGIGVVDGAEAIFESGKVYVTTKSTSGRYVFYLEGAGSELTINGGEFGWNSTLNQKRAYVYAGDGTTVTINGGTFGPASTRSGYTAGIMGTGTVIIKGGTFGFDPSAWVADGYEAVQNGSTWTVSEK